MQAKAQTLANTKLIFVELTIHSSKRTDCLRQHSSCGSWGLLEGNFRACSVFESKYPAEGPETRIALKHSWRWTSPQTSCLHAASITAEPPAELLILHGGLPPPSPLYCRPTWCKFLVQLSLAMIGARIWHCWKSFYSSRCRRSDNRGLFCNVQLLSPCTFLTQQCPITVLWQSHHPSYSHF